MADESPSGERSFLRRWSQRKLAAARDAEAPPRPAPPPQAPPVPAAAADAPTSTPPPVAREEAPSLPDPASLTFDSDFTAFLSPKVDEGVRRAALRKLFSDPRFNAMDGLDVYIDDYSKFEPVTPDILAQLQHVRYLFDPPKTRINERGFVEDVPDEPVPAEAAAEGEGAPGGDAVAAAPAPASPPVDLAQSDGGTRAAVPTSDSGPGEVPAPAIDVVPQPAVPASPR